MYTDKYQRIWEGPYQFTAKEIKAHAPRETGVYQILTPSGRLIYIGIATGDTIAGRLGKHTRGSGNSLLPQLTNQHCLTFGFYRCDGSTARQIEAHIIRIDKPALNQRAENKHFIPSISRH